MPKSIASKENLLETYSLEHGHNCGQEQQLASYRRSRSVITPDVLHEFSRIVDISLILLSSWLTLNFLNFKIPAIGITLGFLLVFNIAFFLSRQLPLNLLGGQEIDQQPISIIGMPLILCTTIAGLTIHFIPRTGNELSYWMIFSLLLSLPVLIIGRLAYKKLISIAIKKNLISWNIALYGTNQASLNYLMEHSDNTGEWKKIIAVFTDIEDHFSPAYSARNPVSKLEKSIRTGSIDEVIVFLEDHEPARRQEIIDALSALPVRITLHYGIENKWLVQKQRSENTRHCLLELTNSPLHGWRCLAKRATDIIVSSIAIVVTAPLLALIALLIKLDNPGPVLFVQQRYGFNNKVIHVLKFRSMYHNESGEDTFVQARKNDHRITRIGSFIRKTSIDELPQLFNVLKGDMSIVGPRPHAVKMDDQYKQVIKNFNARYTVVPGITGWAQINGARGETPDLDSMEKRFSLDRYYIANWSLWLDIKIMFLTATRIWNDRHAY